MSQFHIQGKYLRVESHPFGVKKMIFTRPDMRNAFHAQMISDITEALKQLAAIDSHLDMRLLIIQGEGSTFCAGADLNYMKEQAQQDEEKNIQDAKQLADMFYTLCNFPTPVISAVQGAAVAGGLGIVACSDYALAHENAIFSTSEVLLGIVPGVISPYIIRKVGVLHSSHLMLTGKRISAPAAAQINLINRVTNEDSFASDLEKITKEFLMAGPLAARKTKELIKANAPLPNSHLVDFTTKQIAQARSSEEGKSGLSCFFDKKIPSWQLGIGDKK